MRLARVVTAVVAALLPLLVVSAASAFDQKTKWYTIRIAPPDDVSSHLFLTQTSNGLRLERYRSGDVTQMWAPTQPEYPAPSAITVIGQDSTGQGCFNTFPPQCDFRGEAGNNIEFKVVSRSSGKCIAVGATRATTAACANSVNEAAWERLTFWEEIGPGKSSQLRTGSGNCLVANTDDPYGQSMRLRAQPCVGNDDWYTFFKADLVADLDCRVDWEWDLCFVQGD